MSRKKKADRPNARGVDIPPPPDEVLDQVPSPAAVVRRRRTKRLIFLAVVAVLIPVVEVVAYQFRSILLVVRNGTERSISEVTATYPGGKVELGEIKPGGEATRSIRPNYEFSLRRNVFSSYPFSLRVRTADGGISHYSGREGTIDYSAQEVFVVGDESAQGLIGIRHTTRPGFPLGAIRDLMHRLGAR